MGRKSKTYFFDFCVRGYELDSYQHVNNAVYLNYAEQARWELFKQLGLLEDMKSSGNKVVIVEVNIKYIRQLQLLDEVRVETQIELSKPFLIFHQHLFNGQTNKIAAKAEVKGLFLDHFDKPCDVPEPLLAFLTEE